MHAVGLKSPRGSKEMHNNELYEDVRTRDYCAITAKVKGARLLLRSKVRDYC